MAGEVHTAAHHNTYERDNIAWLATDSPACRVYNNANFSHNSSGNFLAVTFNSERFDNAAMHSTSSNTDRITIPTGGGGKYLIGGATAFAAAAGGTSRITGIGINGITTFAAAQSGYFGAGLTTYISVFTSYAVSAADYVVLPAYQDTGGSLNILQANNYSPEFYAVWSRT